jgi:hypothetical protein
MPVKPRVKMVQDWPDGKAQKLCSLSCRPKFLLRREMFWSKKL